MFSFFCFLTQINLFSIKTCYYQAFFLTRWCAYLTYFKDSIERLVYKFKLAHIVQVVEDDGDRVFKAA